ncbi:restriction endonuclease subunit S [Psychrobacter glacincola]|uniref:restriction endonuclease subunit S n=1 Tax=Psychrobacter glacincola TaxID=56810 RepID=UPI003FD500B7
MASDWKTTTFEESSIEILDGDRGKNYPKKSEFTESGYCLFLNTGNVTKDGFKFSSTEFVSSERDQLLRKGKLQREDVVLTTRGTVGNVAYYDSSIPFDHIRINSGMVILRSDDTKILPRYLYLFLRSKLFEDQVIALQSGSAQPQLPIRDIKRVEIKVPSVTEQKTIAHILGTLDDKIELNRQMNETLEAMAQALFKSWFVDFDPVIDNALAAGNAIPDEFFERAEQRKSIEKKDNSDIQGLFPDAFEFTEEMGWIPKGWGTSEVNGFGQVVCGKTPSKQKAEYYGNDISFIKIPDMHNVAWATTTIDNLSFEGSNSQKNKLIPKGSICVSCIATVGKVLMTSRDAHTNQQINSLIPAEKNTLYYLYSSFLGMEKILQDLASGGAVTLNLNTSNFSKIKLILPPNPVLDAYDSSVSSLYEKNLKSLIQNQELAKLRDTLLPKLMSGELRIVDAAAFVENI